VLAILYDIHGNLPALEAVIADARAAGVTAWFLGGDYGAPSPWPVETLELLRTLEPATWIRGNGERWIFDRPADRPEVAETYDELLPGPLSDADLRWLYALPPHAELDGVLYVHGCVGRDDDTFGPEPAPEDEQRVGNVRDTTIVFGHNHVQFRRAGPSGNDLLNPGSVGMPLDGDRRAAWALRREDGEFAFRRTEYDVARAATAWRELGGDFGTFVAERLERGSD
jgi:predicted phosphodiesterase